MNSTSLNMSQICALPQPQFIKEVGFYVTLPSLMIFLGIVFLILLVSGLFLISGSESKKKFFSIWVLNLVLSLFVLIGIFLNPVGIADLFSKALGIFK